MERNYKVSLLEPLSGDRLCGQLAGRSLGLAAALTFERAGLSYFNPHSFRNTLAQLGEEVCKAPEQFKAWSQNLGHEKVLTTFLSYGEVACHRQGEIIRNLATPQRSISTEADEIAEAIYKKLNPSIVGRHDFIIQSEKL